MDDALVVGCLQGPRKLFDQRCRFTRWQRRSGQLIGQAAAGAEFQGEEGQSLVHAELEHQDDAGVADGGDGLGLRQETSPTL
jgi:hypothetical protein